MIIVQNSPSMIVRNLYLLSIQKAPFIIVTMLTHYTVRKILLRSLNFIEGGLYHSNISVLVRELTRVVYLDLVY